MKLRIPYMSLILLGLVALASCHDKQSDEANATMAVDENLITPNTEADKAAYHQGSEGGLPAGAPPYMIFCAPKDPRGEPVLAQTMEWPDKKHWPTAGRGYKKCTVDWAH